LKGPRLILFPLLGAAAAFAWTRLQVPVQTPVAPAVQTAPGEDRASVREKLKASAAERRDAENALTSFAQRFWSRGKGANVTRELNAVQDKLSKLTKLYTPRHPLVANLSAQEKTLQERRDQLLEQDADYRRLALELRRRQDENRRLWNLYDGMKDAPTAQIPARPPEAATPAPDWRPLAVGAGIGLFTALLGGMSFEGRPAGGDVESAERSAGSTVLAAVPPTPSRRRLFKGHPLDEARRRLVLLHAPDAPMAEAYRELLAGLRLPARPGGRPAPTVGITSPSASDKKTAAALNVAFTAARSGLKTLFIEADIRRPAAHVIMGLPAEPGLSDAVRGRREWASSVKSTADLLFARVGLDALLKTQGFENFNFLACGASALPADVLGAPHLETILKDMRTRYDLLVFDVPAALEAADALALAPRLDAVVLVQERKGAQEPLRRARERLLNVKTPLAGLLLI
jgi:Mrp family chromosome partitioning ATPase